MLPFKDAAGFFGELYRRQAEWFLYLAMLAFILGLALAAACGFAVSLLPYLLGAVLLLLLVSLLARVPELMYPAFILLGLLWGGMAQAQLASFPIPADEAVFFSGRVVEVGSNEENYFSQLAEYQSGKYTFVLAGQEERGWRGRLQVIGSPVRPKVGDKLSVAGVVREFSQTHNLNVAANDYLAGRGISAMLQPVPGGLSFSKLAGKYTPLALGETIRERVYAAMESLPPLQQALLKGIGFGETGMLTNGQTGVLQQTGVMHVFAVSGLHIGYVVMLAGAAFGALRRRLALSYKFPLICTALAVLFFDCVVGFSASVLRATVMLLAALAGALLLRPHAAPRALIGAAFLLLLFRPLWLTQPGFILSFLATAGIVFTARFWQLLLRNQALAVSFAAQAMTLPVTAYFFHVISFIGVVVSPLVVVAAGVVVLLMVLAMLLAPLGLSLIPLAGAGLCAEWTYRLAELFARLPQAFQYTVSPGWGAILVYYLLLFAAYFILARSNYEEEHEEDREDVPQEPQQNA